MIFSPIFNKNSTKPIYIQLYEYIKEEIIKGNIKANQKLPSIRDASNSLKVSKTTIENAYYQLLVEGYIDSIPKKGYFVINLSVNFNVNSKEQINQTSNNKISYQKETDFINAGADINSFDFILWKKLYNKIILEKEELLYSSGNTQGEYDLRKQIAQFVKTTKGANCTPNRIVVGAGVQYLLGILISVISNDYTTAAVEDPGYKKAEYIFEDYNLKVSKIPVTEDGLSLDELKKFTSTLVYISPSHQYPLGSVMPINKRLKILDWANKSNSLIIEDDYDSIIRFESMPVPCLQGLDKNDSVIYLGSFSKILVPSLRISYMILPSKLINYYENIKERFTQSSSKIDQFTLAKFIEEGYMEKQLRKVGRIYKKKINELTKCINENSDNIKVLNADSGLHIVIEATTSKETEHIIKSAVRNNIYLEIIKRTHNKVLISLNYSGIKIEEISQFVKLLINSISSSFK